MATPDTWKGSPDRRDHYRAFSYDDDHDYSHTVSYKNKRSLSHNCAFTRKQGARETGVVEKLLHSYGFIHCCERELRIFFHYSQYNGDTEELVIGDEMEFEVSSDQRTGKPIACHLTKLQGGSVSFEIQSEGKVKGVVDAEPLMRSPYKNTRSPSNGLNPEMGRVSYERNGECFYLPFSVADVLGSSPLHKGDKVEFYVATDKRTGSVRARDVELTEAIVSERYQGVVSSIKESFGFIERADKVSEIFFHYSEFVGSINEVMLGDDVEFSIQERNGKEVAVSVEKLPEGTVLFEDVSEEKYQGFVERALSRSSSKRQYDPLHGKIVFDIADGTDEVVFSERDLQGEFSLCVGDVVEFNVAVDRRDHLKRATNINIIDVAAADDGEARENGVIASLKEGFGFIRCCDRDARMFFHFSELMDSNHQIQPGDEVEFTVAEDVSGSKRLHAVHVRYLPRGTIQMENVSVDRYQGFVEREALFGIRSPRKADSYRETESGLIVGEVDGKRETLSFDPKTLELRGVPQFGDLVEFNVSESRRTGFKKAVNITVVGRNSEARHQGFVATLKENFGFLETIDHDKEVFFHYSEFDGDASELNLGDEVEYSLKGKAGKVSAELLVKLPQGTVPPEEVLPNVYEGVVLRPLRRADPQQTDYAGLIEAVAAEQENGEENGEEVDAQSFSVEYGITSLVDKKTVLQSGDKVHFQLGLDKRTNRKRSIKVAAVRQRLRARVESLKGQFGFIGYENEESKNIFFHMSEVEGEAELQIGDEVEFVVVQNQRTGKMSACSVRRISELQRPERLLLKLKGIEITDNTRPRFEAIRKPLGPDGTRGFTFRRSVKENDDETDAESDERGGMFEELVSKLCD